MQDTGSRVGVILFRAVKQDAVDQVTSSNVCVSPWFYMQGGAWGQRGKLFSRGTQERLITKGKTIHHHHYPKGTQGTKCAS